MKPGKNQQVIRRLIDAVSDNDRDRIQSFISQTGPISETFPDEHSARQQFEWQLMFGDHKDVEKVDWRVDQLIEDEAGRVFTRGCLRYLVDGQWAEFVVDGSFEVKGSKVVQWS